MATPITASMLYNFIQCPHRVELDLFGNPSEKDEVSVFIQLLWEKGNSFEQQVIENIKIPFTNLKPFWGAEKERLTLEAMQRGDPLIYSARICSGNLLGEPDLLRRKDAGYVAIDIKSGAGEENAGDKAYKKPKKHYGVQLALYTEILEHLGFLTERTAFVWDVHGDEISYELETPLGERNPQSMWDFYQEVLTQVQTIISKEIQTTPANSAMCKLCVWRRKCLKILTQEKDLTLIPELGRSKRDLLVQKIKNIPELAQTDLADFSKGKKTVFPGIGLATLEKYQTRARLQMQPNAQPYLTEPHNLPEARREIFFDIETDPMRDVCYLHGFYERQNQDNRTEKYVAFFADNPGPEQERIAFAEAWRYVQASQPCMIYYYSKYERTIWRNLQEKYPDIASPEEIEAMFSPERSIDLYFDVVRAKTEWPTKDYSIKTLAVFLGFRWRDKDPSGASSIEWYHRWVESHDQSIKQRILDYNEDDCIATRILLDGIRRLQIKNYPEN